MAIDINEELYWYFGINCIVLDEFLPQPISSPGGSSASSRDGSPSRDFSPLIGSLKPPVVIKKGPRGFGFTLRAIRVLHGRLGLLHLAPSGGGKRNDYCCGSVYVQYRFEYIFFDVVCFDLRYWNKSPMVNWNILNIFYLKLVMFYFHY